MSTTQLLFKIIFYFNVIQRCVPWECDWFMESIQRAFLSFSARMKKFISTGIPSALTLIFPSHMKVAGAFMCVCNSVWSLTWMPLSVSPLSALRLAHGYEPETSSEPHPTPSPRNPFHPPHSYQKAGTDRKWKRARECVRKTRY